MPDPELYERTDPKSVIKGILIITSLILLAVGLIKVFESPTLYSADSGIGYLIRMFKGIALIGTSSVVGILAVTVKK